MNSRPTGKYQYSRHFHQDNEKNIKKVLQIHQLKGFTTSSMSINQYSNEKPRNYQPNIFGANKNPYLYEQTNINTQSNQIFNKHKNQSFNSPQNYQQKYLEHNYWNQKKDIQYYKQRCFQLEQQIIKIKTQRNASSLYKYYQFQKQQKQILEQQCQKVNQVNKKLLKEYEKTKGQNENLIEYRKQTEAIIKKSVKTIDTYKKDLQKSNYQIIIFKQNISKLQQAKKRIIKQTKEQNNKLNQTIKDLNSIILNRQKQIKSLKETKLEREKQFKSLQKIKLDYQKLQIFLAQNSKKLFSEQQKNQKLNKQIINIRAIYDLYDELSQNFQKLTNDNNKKQTTIKQYKQQNNKLHVQLSKLNIQNQRFRKQFQQLKRSFKLLSQNSISLQQFCKNLQAQENIKNKNIKKPQFKKFQQQKQKIQTENNQFSFKELFNNRFVNFIKQKFNVNDSRISNLSMINDGRSDMNKSNIIGSNLDEIKYTVTEEEYTRLNKQFKDMKQLKNSIEQQKNKYKAQSERLNQQINNWKKNIQNKIQQQYKIKQKQWDQCRKDLEQNIKNVQKQKIKHEEKYKGNILALQMRIKYLDQDLIKKSNNQSILQAKAYSLQEQRERLSNIVKNLGNQIDQLKNSKQKTDKQKNQIDEIKIVYEKIIEQKNEQLKKNQALLNKLTEENAKLNKQNNEDKDHCVSKQQYQNLLNQKSQKQAQLSQTKSTYLQFFKNQQRIIRKCEQQIKKLINLDSQKQSEQQAMQTIHIDMREIQHQDQLSKQSIKDKQNQIYAILNQLRLFIEQNNRTIQTANNDIKLKKDQIQKQKTQIKQKDIQIQQAIKQIQSLRKLKHQQTQKLNQEIKQKAEQIKQLQQKVQQQDKQIEELISKLNDDQDRFQPMEQDEQKQRQIKNLQQQITNKQKRIQQLANINLEFQNINLQLKRQKQQLNNQNSILKGQKTKLNNQNTQLQTTIKQINVTIEQITTNQSNQQKQLTQKQKQIDSLNNKYESSISQITNLNQSISKFKQQNQKQKQQMAKFKQFKQQANKSKEKYDLLVKQSDQAKASRQQAIRKLKNQYEDLLRQKQQEHAKNIKQAKDDHKKQMESLVTKYQEYFRKKQQQIKQIKQANQIYVNKLKQQHSQQLQKAIQQTKNQKDKQYKSQIQVLIKKIQQLLQKIRQLQKRIQQLQSYTQQQSMQIMMLFQERKEKQKQIQDIKIQFKIKQQQTKKKHQTNLISVRQQQEQKYQKIKLDLIQSHKKQIQSLKKKIDPNGTPQNQLSIRYKLGSSDILYSLNQSKAKSLVEQIQKGMRKNIIRSSFLYRFHQNQNCNVNPHLIIDGKPNLLLLVKLKNGQVMGGFSEKEYFKPKQEIKNWPWWGTIFNLNNNKFFYLKKQQGKKVLTYDPYYISFGNHQIRIRYGQTLLHTNFENSSEDFDSMNAKKHDFIGQGQATDAEFDYYQLHQVIFQGDQLQKASQQITSYQKRPTEINKVQVNQEREYIQDSKTQKNTQKLTKELQQTKKQLQKAKAEIKDKIRYIGTLQNTIDVKAQLSSNRFQQKSLELQNFSQLFLGQILKGQKSNKQFVAKSILQFSQIQQIKDTKLVFQKSIYTGAFVKCIRENLSNPDKLDAVLILFKSKAGNRFAIFCTSLKNQKKSAYLLNIDKRKTIMPDSKSSQNDGFGFGKSGNTVTFGSNQINIVSNQLDKLEVSLGYGMGDPYFNTKNQQFTDQKKSTVQLEQLQVHNVIFEVSQEQKQRFQSYIPTNQERKKQQQKKREFRFE